MGWGFRKSTTIGPGLRLNLSKRSVGLSAGRRGARVSGNPRGRKSVSLSWKGALLAEVALVASYPGGEGEPRRRLRSVPPTDERHMPLLIPGCGSPSTQ
jgi:hypothetical protein